MIRNNKGLTLVEGLVAAAIVATSILAIGTMVTRYSNISKRADAKQELPGVSTDVLNRTRAVMTDKKAPNGRETQALCALLVPEVVRSGVVPINVKLTNSLATEDQWKAAFAPDWTMTSYANVKNRISFAVKPKLGVNPLAASKSIDAETLEVQIKIFPQKMDPTGASADVFTDIPNSEDLVDSKRVVFFIESKTRYVEIGDGNQRTQRETISKELISVIDIGSCDVLDPNGSWLTMSPAGTGSGDPTGKTIYNDTQYSKKVNDAFKFNFTKGELTQGRYKNGRLGADREKNAIAACSETIYRCPKNNEKARRYRPFINMTTGINYSPLNRYTSRKVMSVRAIPKMELRDDSGKDFLTNASISYTMRPGVSYVRHTDRLYYVQKTDGTPDLNSPMAIGENQERIIATVNNAEPLCQNICGGARAKGLMPFLSLETPDLQDKGKPVIESSSAGALSCTMCFTKACARMGLETFGPLEEMPPEPLDSVIPECAADNPEEARKFLPYNEKTIANVTTGQCISARLDSGGRFVYKTRNCGDSLPVACFAYGEYTLARTLDEATPVRVAFADAPNACRQLGRERHAIATLNAAFEQQGSGSSTLASIPKSGQNYAFLNMAKVGTFIMPQAEEDLSFAANSLRKKAGNEEFWVALRTQQDHVIADFPMASTSNSADESHFIYYNGSGRITHTQVATTLNQLVNQPSSDADRVYMLMNHARYRGLVPASRSQSRVSAFLCLRAANKSFFFSSSGSVSFADGGKACERDGGLFVAPHTPQAWLSLLMKVDSNLDYAPFNLQTDPNRVWVALQGPANSMDVALLGQFEDLGKSASPHEGHSINVEVVDANGSFVVNEGNLLLEKKIEQPDPDGPGPLPRPPPKIVWEANPAVQLKVACYDRADKKIRAVSLQQGCGSNKRIMKDDLRKPIYSMLWVLSKDDFNLGRYDFIKVVN